MKHSFCEDWEFTQHWTEAFGKGLPVPKQQAVRLPHTCREVPLHYASPADYEMVCGYRKRFRVPPVQAAPRLFLRFDGAAHQAVVRVNGRVAGQHRGGYTGFAVEITDLVDREGENLLKGDRTHDTGFFQLCTLDCHVSCMIPRCLITLKCRIMLLIHY